MSKIKIDGLDQYGKVQGFNGMGDERVKNVNQNGHAKVKVTHHVGVVSE